MIILINSCFGNKIFDRHTIFTVTGTSTTTIATTSTTTSTSTTLTTTPTGIKYSDRLDLIFKLEKVVLNNLQIIINMIIILFLGNLILVATGYIGYNGYIYPGYTPYTNVSQVIDVSSTNACSDLATYPLTLFAGNGGILDGAPVICGGVGKMTAHVEQRLEINGKPQGNGATTCDKTKEIYGK